MATIINFANPASSADNNNRYCLFARVSTNRQLIEGNGLQEQVAEMKRFLKDKPWINSGYEYVHQEESLFSSGDERTELNKFLEDCKKNLFDIVVCWDVQRLGRNTEDKIRVFNTLRRNDIKLYSVLSGEIDINNNMNQLVQLIQSIIGEDELKKNLKQAINVRYERTSRGFPQGKKPFGRICTNINERNLPNVEAKWIVDPKAKALTEELARLYLVEGKTFSEISRLKNIHLTKVRNILLRFASGKWEIEFDGTHINNRKVIIDIPELLDKSTIDNIRDKALVNKKYANTNSVIHPLAGYVRCFYCNATLAVHTNQSNYKDDSIMHRSFTHRRENRKTLMCIKYVNANRLEEKVIKGLVSLFSNSDNLKEAINNVVGKTKIKKEDLKTEITDLENKLKKADSKLQKLEEHFLEGLVRKETIAKKSVELVAEINVISKELELKKSYDQIRNSYSR